MINRAVRAQCQVVRMIKRALKITLITALFVAFGVMTGCASTIHQPNMQQIQQSYSQLESEQPAGQLAERNGYLCTATNQATTKRPSTAWSPHLADAKAYALSRCESHSRPATDCKIESCASTGAVTTVADNRWFTCYVPNHESAGVWSATGHKRVATETVAYNRCVQFSANAGDCYLSYCRIW